jgi:hypothetical protein
MRRRIRLRAEVTVETRRIYLTAPGPQRAPECGDCGAGAMVGLAVAATLTGLSGAALVAGAAGGTLHHRWTEDGELLVCLRSVSDG